MKIMSNRCCLQASTALSPLSTRVTFAPETPALGATTRLMVVFGHQHVQASGRLLFSGGVVHVGGLRWRAGTPQTRTRAFAHGAFTLGSPHQPNEAGRNAQAQPGAAKAAGDGAVGLRKRLEHGGQLLRCDADAGVGHAEAQPVLAGAGEADAHIHMPGFGEPDGVAHRVEQHLAQAAWVAQQPLGYVVIDVGEQFQALGFGPLMQRATA